MSSFFTKKEKTMSEKKKTIDIFGPIIVRWVVGIILAGVINTTMEWFWIGVLDFPGGIGEVLGLTAILGYPLSMFIRWAIKKGKITPRMNEGEILIIVAFIFIMVFAGTVGITRIMSLRKPLPVYLGIRFIIWLETLTKKEKQT